MLTPAEFDLASKAAVLVFALAWASLSLAPHVRAYRKACRRDDLMGVADAAFGPDRERLP